MLGQRTLDTQDGDDADRDHSAANSASKCMRRSESSSRKDRAVLECVETRRARLFSGKNKILDLSWVIQRPSFFFPGRLTVKNTHVSVGRVSFVPGFWVSRACVGPGTGQIGTGGKSVTCPIHAAPDEL